MNQVLDKSLLGGVLCSLAVHAAVGLAIAWTGDRSLAQRESRQPEPVLVSLLPPPKPPEPVEPPKPPEPAEPPLMRLGIEESVADTMAWLGFSEETEHAAPPLGMDQSAMELEPGNPGPPQPATINSKPSEAARDAQSAPPIEPAPPATEPVPPAPSEPAIDPARPQDAAPAPPAQPPTPSEATQAPVPPIPAPAPAPSEAAPKPADPVAKPADVPLPPVEAKPDIKPPPEPPRVEELPKPIEPKPIESKPAEPKPIEPVVAPPVVQPAEIEPPPDPLPVPLPLPAPWNVVTPPTSEAVPPPATKVEPPKEQEPPEDLDPVAEAAEAIEEATVVPDSGPAPATPETTDRQNPPTPAAPAQPAPAVSVPAPQQPASVAAPPGGGGRPGERSDRESDPSSAKPVHVEKWKLGKVLAAKGVEIRTTRPYWSTTTMLTTSPRDPAVRVKFSRTGKVTSAEFVDDLGSGYESVDGPLIDAIYRWTASGKPLRELPATDPNARLTIVFVISLR